MRISDWSSDVCSSDLLHVLLTQRRDHVGGGEAVGGELLRIDPDPQRELALAEEDQIADAVESQQQVAYPRAGVVGDIELVVAVVRRQHVHHHHQVGRALRRGDTEARSEEHTSELQSLMRISYAVFCL